MVFCETVFCETGFGETGFGETGFGETGFAETGRNRFIIQNDRRIVFKLWNILKHTVIC